MYKVVIVDDEPIIAEGLRKVVRWSDHNCQVVATANSGQQGLEVIRQHQPHIIFSDISMPGMDGLSMIAALRSEFPDTYIAILTGYRDFNYAQRAIHLGVFRFLLKPSNMKEIEQAVEDMVKKLDERKEWQEWQDAAEILLNEVKEQKYSAKISEETAGEAVFGAVDCGHSDSACTESANAAQTGVMQTGAAQTGTAPAGTDMSSGGDHEANSFVVNNAIKFMEANYQRKITLIDVADHVYVSQWHLSKLLNRYTGKNFSEILNGCRIEAAKKLLAEPGLRIADIAEEVGFADTAHFSRVFKKLTGVSANEYRNSL